MAFVIIGKSQRYINMKKIVLIRRPSFIDKVTENLRDRGARFIFAAKMSAVYF